MNPTEFLTLLWGEKPPGFIQLWQLDGRRSRYIQTPKAANPIVAGHPTDMYTAVALAHQDHGPTRRTSNAQAYGIAGVWLDIDIKLGSAADRNTALNLAHEVLAPSVLVDSGHGVHAWWLLEQGPWIFKGREEQERAADLAFRWFQLHRDIAGFSIDAAHDLARLLRLPGTVNAKTDPVPVTVLSADGPRHPLALLLELVANVKAVRPAEEPPQVDGELDTARLTALLANERFRALWNHEGERPGWSLSEYDLALASAAAGEGWTRPELAVLIREHRVKWGEKAKGVRPDYVNRTIDRAQREIAMPEVVTTATHAREGALNPEQWKTIITAGLNRNGSDAIALPFEQLTKDLDGGLRRGEVCLVAGYTSHGKTLLVDAMADVAASQDMRVFLYMTEMTAYARGLRLLARRTNVPFGSLKRRELTDTDWKEILWELEHLPYGCANVVDWSVDQVVQHIRENEWDLAVVDLIHGFGYQNERDLSNVSTSIVRAAKGGRGTAIVAAAHLNDGMMQGSRILERPAPGLHSIKGSTSLKQDADVVIFVWQQDNPDGFPTGEGAVWIAKARDGEVGNKVRVRLDTAKMMFVESHGVVLRGEAV